MDMHFFNYIGVKKNNKSNYFMTKNEVYKTSTTKEIILNILYYITLYIV